MPIHDWTRVDEGIFHAFHVNWTVELAKALNAGILSGEYYALPEQVAGETHPDMLTLRYAASPDEPREGPPRPASESRDSAAVDPEAPSTAQVLTLTAPTYERLARLVSIRHVSGDQVVAIVELVSRSNKRTLENPGLLAAKTCNALRLGIHVLAVDLYPPGPHDPDGLHVVIWESMGGEAPPRSPRKPLLAVSYEAIGREGDSQRLRAFVEPLAVGDEIPSMPLFLRPGFHVKAPLASTYEIAFASIPRRWREVIEGGQPSPQRP
jgi:hypothetical protein